MFSFFKKSDQKIQKDEPSFEIELTAAVLAYEIARIDGDISSDELKILMEEIKIIAKKVGKEESEILKIIVEYCDENDIEATNSTPIFEDLKSKKQKGYTKKTSLKLFKSGKSVLEIANERDLTTNTIAGHLASFIPSGEVKVTDLISEESYNELKKIIPKKQFESLSDLKNQLDDKYSYGEIRLVLEDLKT